jgi:hypothetical protein
MPLVKAILKAELEAAFSKENSPAAAADKLSTAIDNYIRSMTITIPPGIPVATVGSPAAQTGATTGPGSGVVS